MYTIVKWQGVATIASKDSTRHFNSTLTNMKIVLFAQSCSEFLTTIQSLSSVFHYDNVTTDDMV